MSSPEAEIVTERQREGEENTGGGKKNEQELPLAPASAHWKKLELAFQVDKQDKSLLTTCWPSGPSVFGLGEV